MSADDHHFARGDRDDEPMAGPGGPGGNLCFLPGDDGEGSTARLGGPGGGGGQACFHPGDEEGAPTNRLADDLAADLHLALTGIDDRQLALLA
ncbi:hypothetical protein O7598_10180 [Micromonospora sp. WMMC241]|uniref:hypothetical protein n=1 Tax=Micromonospora sp. WMMC241 TaxID=3015159 RepID=UPI0022B6D9A8|nr:hypothetical protein [Micromonospora sp. WMMC241]MCZ7436758.1 hypothetical protein [Micromonospora sp. WMMC241]